MAATVKCDTVVNAASATNNLALDTSGNVTVGNNLTVTGTTTQTGAASFTGQILTAAGTAGAPAVARSGDADNGIFFPATNTMAIATAGTEDMRFTPEGNVTMNSATFSPTTPGTAGNMAMTGTLAMGSSFLRNAIINGAMQIWQRGTSFTNPAAAGSFYTADRMGVNRAGDVTGATVSQSSSAPTGFQYSMNLQRTAGNALTAGLYLYYSAETADSIRFQGKNITLSFYAKAGEIGRAHV